MILFITRKYPPSVGGMQKLSFQLYENISAHTLIHVIHWGKSQKWLPFFVFWAFFRTLIVSYQEDVRIIYVGDPVLSPLGLILGYILHLPTVVNAHGLDITYPNPFYQKMISFCLPRMDHVICISQHTQDECRKKGVLLSKSTVIHPGLDIKNYCATISNENKLAALSNWCIPYRDQKILISVGRLVPRKGIAPFILNTLPLLSGKLDQWIYIIVGEGPENIKIKTAIKNISLSENIVCLGSIDEPALKTAYAIADVFIMPNIHVPNQPEGFGLVSIEAQASGLPVVLSDLEGIRDTKIEGADADLIEPENWVEFAESINKWISRVDSLEERILRQKTVYDHYDWKIVTPRILDVFRTVQLTYRRK